MRAIFAEAVDQGFLPKDPARKVKPPANLREVDKTTLSWDQLRAALEKLDELSLRDWILMKLDMSNALRPSELFPLRWRCFLEEKHILDIQETVYKGKIRPYGKTKESLTSAFSLLSIIVAPLRLFDKIKICTNVYFDRFSRS
jgi:integrase